MDLVTSKIERRYLRLCRNQEEIGRLDFKKAAPGVSPEDFVFSRIDFSRYREIDEKLFEGFFLESFSDFDDVFFIKNFGRGKEELLSLIQENYKKTTGFYKLQRESPLIISVMRCLDTCLDEIPLLTPEETEKYGLSVSSLDGLVITHKDGVTTKLFISPEGNLAGTFQPAGKPWTRVLILR